MHNPEPCPKAGGRWEAGQLGTVILWLRELSRLLDPLGWAHATISIFVLGPGHCWPLKDAISGTAIPQVGMRHASWCSLAHSKPCASPPH